MEIEVRVGQEAPDFTLPDQDQRDVRLGEFRGRSVLLVFYGFDWDPQSDQRLARLQDQLAALSERDIQVLAVSVDSVPCHRAYAAQHALRHPLLSDVHRTVCRLYGILCEETAAALPASFLVDPGGVIRYHAVSDPRHAILVRAFDQSLGVQVDPPESLAEAAGRPVAREVAVVPGWPFGLARP